MKTLRKPKKSRSVRVSPVNFPVVVIFLIVVLSYGIAGAVTIDFTEVFSDPPPANRSLTGDEWAAYGITLSNCYWYADTRDPFDYYGISQTTNPGIINFIVPTNSATIDWATLSTSITVSAFNNNVLLDSFSYPAGSGLAYGTDTLSGSSITSLQFHDEGRQVGISTLDFTPVPEPATMVLLGLGGLLLRQNRR